MPPTPRIPPEQPIQIETAGGVLEGHAGGAGVPALLLHGGPGLPDYMGGCATELGRLFTTVRYTQRGVEPTTVGPPYTVESHLEDALAVMDALGLQKAWAIGHSWGGHLALHLAAAHPERLYGIVTIDTMSATMEELPELQRAIAARLPGVELSESPATGEELVEELRLAWPAYFADPASAPPPLVDRASLECNRQTMASATAHVEAGTLTRSLREVRLPALLVHGIDDPLPVSASTSTAKLIPGARVGRVPRCGHFPWLEQPGFLDRMLRGLIAEL